MKPFGYVIFIAIFSLAPLLFLFKYLPNLDKNKTSEKLEGLGVVVVDKPSKIDFSGFIDHRRLPFEADRLEGKWTFAYFGFTRCPDFCPTTLSVLANAEKSLANNMDNFDPDSFQGALFTIDPSRDNPERLEPYVKTFSDRFVGVWSEKGLDALAVELDVVFEEVPMQSGGYMFDHTSNLVIISPDAQYFGYIRRPHSVEQIEEIFMTLQNESMLN